MVSIRSVVCFPFNSHHSVEMKFLLLFTLMACEILICCFFERNLPHTALWFTLVYFAGLLFEREAERWRLPASFEQLSELLSAATVPLKPASIEIVDSVTKVGQAVQLLSRKCAEFSVLGTDCEMQARRRQPPLVQLLQMATKNGHCVLFRVHFMPFLESSLLELLSNEEICKTGVGVYNDMEYLRLQYGSHFTIKATLDLRYLAHYFGYIERGLKSLAVKILKTKLNEHSGQGTWHDEQLTPDRILYAAMDAYLGVILFHHFYVEFLQKKYERMVFTEEFKKDKLASFLRKWQHKQSKQFREDYY